MDQAARLRKLISKSPQERARVITVASGKGGVGKTNIVVNLGLIMARQGQRILIFDADLGLANADILLGLAPRYSMLDVIAGQRNLRDIIVYGPHNLLLLPGISGIEELAELDADSRKFLMNELATLAAEMDIIIVDSGAGISRTVFSFAAAAGEAIVITTPEPTSIADAYCLIKGLQRFSVRMHLLVNRCTDEEEGVYTARRLEVVCSRFLQMRLPLLGLIPDDRHVSEAVKKQQPYSMLYPRCQASVATKKIAAKLQGRELPRTKRRGFWQRLGGLLGRL